MRIIKFRGKRLFSTNNEYISNKNNNWIYGDLISNSFNLENNNNSFYYILEQKTTTDINQFNLLNELENSKVYIKSIGQFTNFKDKDKKEIYEGDIIRVSHLNGQVLIGIGIVTFNNSRWEIQWLNNDSSVYLRCDLDFIHEKRIIEVIDNTYDNNLLLLDN